MSPSAAKTTRTGMARGCSGPRTVSEGSSARAVTPPTPMASKPARSQCTNSRASEPEIQREWPLASAMRPSRVVASLSATNGRDWAAGRWRNVAFWAAASSLEQAELDLDAGGAQAGRATRRRPDWDRRSAATTRRTPAR